MVHINDLHCAEKAAAAGNVRSGCVNLFGGQIELRSAAAALVSIGDRRANRQAGSCVGSRIQMAS